MAAAAFLFGGTTAKASPWAEPGDAQLRSDIEILANVGLIDGITTQWPLPWPGLLKRLAASGALDSQPAYVAAAGNRVLREGTAEISDGGLRTQFYFDATNDPSFVRGFDDTGRESVQSQYSAELMLPSTALRLNIGVQSSSTFKPVPPSANIAPTFNPNTGYFTSGYSFSDIPDHQTLLFDGSYLAQRLGDSVVYAGYLSHWWGPGWISSLMMSSNARPFPQIGVSRVSTEAFSWPILRWLGPWQAEFLVGVLDGPSIVSNILTDSLRVDFNPFHGLEIGISRTQLLCGTEHPCKPLVSFFQITHNNSESDSANSSGQIDFRYGNSIGGIQFSVYMQDMFMDTSYTDLYNNSDVFGTSVWIPKGESTIRLTAEFTTSVATGNLFAFDNLNYGWAYNTPKYPEGYRYRGSSLGFSLDGASRLLTLQASYNDAHDRVYTISFDRASVSNSCNAPIAAPSCNYSGVYGNTYDGGVYGNVVTTGPVTIDMLDAKVSIPFHNMKVNLSARIQDDQPRPEHGWTAGLELALVRNL